MALRDSVGPAHLHSHALRDTHATLEFFFSPLSRTHTHSHTSSVRTIWKIPVRSGCHPLRAGNNFALRRRTMTRRHAHACVCARKGAYAVNVFMQIGPRPARTGDAVAHTHSRCERVESDFLLRPSGWRDVSKLVRSAAESQRIYNRNGTEFNVHKQS